MADTNLTWVLQSNAIGPTDLARLSNCIRNQGMRVELIKVVPFSHVPAEKLPVISGRCIVYGSGGLLSVARKAGWFPGGWDGNNFSAQTVNENLGQLSMNNRAVKTVWSKAAIVARACEWHEVFVRPDSETKEFPGKIYRVDALEAFATKLVNSGYLESNNNAVMVAPVVSIEREWRVFVVSGEQVSTSGSIR